MTTDSTSLRQLRYAAINAARLALKAGATYQETTAAIHGACPSLAGRYGDEVEAKIAGMIRFAANQLRVAVPG